MIKLNQLETVFRLIFGTLVAVLGFSVLIGWHTNNVLLIQISPHLTPMQYNTALGLLLSGLSMLCLENHGKILIFLSAIIFLISILTLLQYIFHIDIGIDQLSIKHTININTSHPGRMAPNTAICFLYVSAFFFASEFSSKFKWNNLIALVLCISIGILGLISLSGYFLGVTVLYAWGNFTAMAVHTAAGFLGVSLGCLLFMLNRFLKDDADQNYFPVIIICSISIPLFLISQQALTMHQNKLIKQSIARESIYGESSLIALLSNRFYAIERIFYRGAYHDNYKTDFWKKDINTYFLTFPTLQSVSAEDLLGKIYVYARDANAQKIAKNNVKICHELLQLKNRNFSTVDKNTTLATNDQLLCLEKNPGKFLAIFKIRELFALAFNFPVWKPYGIELKNQSGIVFSKKIKGSTEFFRKQWGISRQFSMFGQPWDLEIWLNEEAVQAQASLFPEFFLLFGLLIMVLLAIVIRMWQLSEFKNRLLEQYKILFNIMDEGFCIIEMIYDENKKPVDWRYLLVNPSFEKQTGLQNVVGKRVREAIPEIEQYWIDTFAETDLTGKSIRFEDFAVALDRWYEVDSFALRNLKKSRVAFLFRDITIRKTYEQNMAAQVRNNKLIYESTVIASNAKSTQKAMQECLNLICKTIGWPVGHIYSLNQNKIPTLESSHTWYLNRPEQMIEFKNISESMQFPKGIGLPGRIWSSKKPAWILDVIEDDNFPRAKYCHNINIHGAVGFPILLDDELIAVFEFFSYESQEYDEQLLHTFEVMSEQISRIFERTISHQKLEKYAQTLQKSNVILEGFAYAASHDLKAPLRVIDNASKWIEEDLQEHLTPETRENMNLLRGRVKRMEKLLDDLLEYSRIGQFQDTHFSEMISGDDLMMNILELLLAPKSFSITVDPYFSKILIHRIPLQQILMNLIGNAIKHHDKQQGHIEVSVKEDEKYYIFSVKDDGPGIAAEFHEKIFNMFQTLKPRDQVEGSGMGLALVKKNIEVFGGEIHIDSTEGKGSTFSFTWPK